MKNRYTRITQINAPLVNRKLFFSAVLVIILYLIYSTPFLSDYLINDEWVNIGMRALDVSGRAKDSFLTSGRGLFGMLEPIVYEFVGYSLVRIQLVRFIYFSLIACLAMNLFLFISNRSKNYLHNFLVVLLLFVQLPFQGQMGYSLQLISNGLPSLLLGVLAFHVHFFNRNNENIYIFTRSIIVLLLLILAIQFSPVYAYFSLIFLVYLILTEWKQRQKSILLYLFIIICSFLFSIIIYKLSLDYIHTIGRQGYFIGEHALSSLFNRPAELLSQAINPLSYWSAFKFWSFPFPINNTPNIGSLRRVAGSCALAVWVLFVYVSLRTEVFIRVNKNVALSKWLAVLICIAVSLLPILADYSDSINDHRPHITLVLIGIVIVISFDCINVLRLRYGALFSRYINYGLILFVVASCFGAQSNVYRGIVNGSASQLDFIRTELVNSRPIKRVVVILPDWYGCLVEPCDPWFGRVSSYTLAQHGGYRYALASLGENPNVEIVFIEKNKFKSIENWSMIDWNKYVLVRKLNFNFLQKN
ncbi:hypothetical protein HY947_04180 [Candidatus Gottesmanbacteria bacterium]|nr:hypothetical protein [Candidatus Gottesmanbacteria bacterium]